MQELSKHETLALVQEVVGEGLVIFAGSGLSASYGMPTMADLSRAIVKRVEQGKEEDRQIEKHSGWLEAKRNFASGCGLEDVLEKVSGDLRALLKRAGIAEIDESEKKAIQSITGSEQDTGLERLIAAAMRASSRLDVVTTNYDRLIELAAGK